MQRYLMIIVIAVLVLSITATVQAGPLDRLEHYALPNGMQVYLLPRNTPTITSIVGYNAGAKQEWLGATGLAHYLEHSAFLGSSKYAESEVEDLLQANGGWSNAATNMDSTMYFNEFPDTVLPQLLEWEADRMQNLTLDVERVKQERDVIQEELRLTSENDIWGKAFDETQRGVFTDSNYSWPVIGKAGDLPLLSRDDLVRFYRTNYHPCNATLVLVGGFDVAKTKALISTNFGSIPAGKKVEYPRTPEPKLNGKRVRVFNGNTEIPLFSMGWRTVGKGHKDALALQLLATVLSGGTHSRLDKRIVYDEGLFSAIFASNISFVLDGFFNIGGSASTLENLPKGESAILNEIQNIVKTGISEEELTTAKNMYLSSYVYRLQTNTAFAFSIFNGVLNNNLDEFKDLNKSLERVSTSEIQRVAREYLSLQDYVSVTVLPMEAENVK